MTKTRAIQVIFAGATTVAALALFSAAHPVDAGAAPAAPAAVAAPTAFATDDGVNDQGQTSGDIFTQNAQDQSTASGAGT